MKNFLCIDFLNLLYRSFYALSQMRTSKGLHTGAIYAFIKTMKKAIDLYQINAIIIFDDSKISKRKEINKNYKAHRESTPNELVFAKKILIEFLTLIKIPIVKIDSYEADDLIVGFIEEFKKKEKEGVIYILSSDKDLHSLLLCDDIFIIDNNKDCLLDKNWLFQTYGQNITKEKITFRRKASCF